MTASLTSSPFDVRVLTLFPQMFPGPLGQGLLGNARARNVWSLKAIDIRNFATDGHRSVDDEAFGGGPGMLLRPDVVGRACDAALDGLESPRLLSLSPRGEVLQQRHLRTWAADRRPLVFLCGRYEGVDQRVADHYGFEEISLGDFVLMGGELAAMVMIEGVVRLLDSVVGNQASLASESFSNDLLEYPQYTRPRLWNGREVPAVLVSGDHGRIQAWRQEEAEKITRQRRPDLWTRFQSRAIDKS